MPPAKIKPPKVNPLDKMLPADNPLSIMKWKPIIITVFVIVVVVLFHFSRCRFYWLFYPPTKNDVIIQFFKDREIFSVIQTPQSVTAQLLHSKNGSSDTLDGYTKDASVGLSDEEIQAIQKLLTEPASYRWGISGPCTPGYDLLLNFHLQGHDVRWHSVSSATRLEFLTVTMTAQRR